MEISLRNFSENWLLRRRSVVVSALFAFALILSQTVETSHAHEHDETEFECEICLQFGFSDDVDVIAAISDFFEKSAPSDDPSIIAVPASLASKANSRGPPQA